MCRYHGAASGPVNVPNNSKMNSLSNPRWKRVVLKISGASLAGAAPHNVDPKVNYEVILFVMYFSLYLLFLATTVL